MPPKKHLKNRGPKPPRSTEKSLKQRAKRAPTPNRPVCAGGRLHSQIEGLDYIEDDYDTVRWI